MGSDGSKENKDECLSSKNKFLLTKKSTTRIKIVVILMTDKNSKQNLIKLMKRRSN